METTNWPLDSNRKFESEHFTIEELTKKQQENDWLRNRDEEDGIYVDYPTNDYSYWAYECMTIDELRRAFLYGNWPIRGCFTYKNLAFINQINAGDEWWTLKKFGDGRLLVFESITMIRTINHETKTWFKDYNTSVFEDGERYRVISRRAAEEHAEALTKRFHAVTGTSSRGGFLSDITLKRLRSLGIVVPPDYVNKEARYSVGDPKDEKKDFGIYFIDIALDYFPDYIEQLLKATYDQCNRTDYTDDEFNEKYRDKTYSPVRRINQAREFGEILG